MRERSRIITGSRDCKEEEGGAGHSTTKCKRLHPLRPSPFHNKHLWVFGKGDANEPGHAHQAINPPHRPGSLLGPSKVVRQPPNASLEGLEDDLPVLWGPTKEPLCRDNGNPKIHVDRLENVIVGDEEVGKGRQNPDVPRQVIAYEKYGGEGRSGGCLCQSSGIVFEKR